MNHRGLMFYTTLLVLGSAVLASQAMRQQRLARATRRHEGKHEGHKGDASSEHDDYTSSKPDLDTSITSHSIPP